MTAAALPVDGLCDPRFAPVREAFVANLTERGDVGAAVAISVGGRPVVDLWGGWLDAARRRPWRRDTLVNVFSVSKGLSTVCALQLVERGLLDLDAPIARCWPEFAAAGKEHISLRQVLTHRAGLPALRAPLPDGAMLDWPCMTAALEAQAPWWTPGAAHGYHVNTFGFLVGEVVRRVSGVSLGTWLRAHVAAPLDADIHIGLPAAEHHRVAEFLWPAGVRPRTPDTFADDDELMRWNAYWNPPGLSGAGWVNRGEWRTAELPSTNGHASARGVARLYAALAAGGRIDGVHVLAQPLLQAAAQEQSNGPDRVLQRPSRFGIGFQLSQPERPLGPNAGAFGHFGTGGSLGYCDPDAGVAFAYVMNDLGPRWQNPRNRALMEALYACL
ncbi:MAG TPA: serine hydrolase domain-containing protein [Candidatus Dormibacteraeota bacterium]|nr:serine hydrolase domain-containing protein [Candidatus Dormibacteraeota bacterium]